MMRRVMMVVRLISALISLSALPAVLACAPIATSQPKGAFDSVMPRPRLVPDGPRTRDAGRVEGDLSAVSAEGLPGFAPEFHPEMTQAEKGAVKDAIAWIGSQPASASAERFDRVFGGPGFADGVFSYLSQRVRYLLSSSMTDPGKHIRYENVALRDETTDAFNIGTALWFIQVADSSRTLLFRFGGTDIPVLESRVGLIRLGSGFVSLPDVARASSLVHEARHSDCTGGMPFEDIERRRRNEPVVSVQCGHTHVRCPGGHRYAGHRVCDSHPWGAYAVQAVFARSISRGCTDCSERERQLAYAVEFESWSRVLVKKNELLSGALGEPDMSSSSQIR